MKKFTALFLALAMLVVGNGESEDEAVLHKGRSYAETEPVANLRAEDDVMRLILEDGCLVEVGEPRLCLVSCKRTVRLARKGFLLYISIFIPSSVFISAIPSAPSSAQAFAIAAISVTFGLFPSTLT